MPTATTPQMPDAATWPKSRPKPVSDEVQAEARAAFEAGVEAARNAFGNEDKNPFRDNPYTFFGDWPLYGGPTDWSERQRQDLLASCWASAARQEKDRLVMESLAGAEYGIMRVGSDIAHDWQKSWYGQSVRLVSLHAGYRGDYIEVERITDSKQHLCHAAEVTPERRPQVIEMMRLKNPATQNEAVIAFAEEAIAKLTQMVSALKQNNQK